MKSKIAHEAVQNHYAVSTAFEIRPDTAPQFRLQVKRNGEWKLFNKKFSLTNALEVVRLYPDMFRVLHRIYEPEAGDFARCEALLITALQRGHMVLNKMIYTVKETPTKAIHIIGGGFNARVSREIAVTGIQHGYFTKEIHNV